MAEKEKLREKRKALKIALSKELGECSKKISKEFPRTLVSEFCYETINLQLLVLYRLGYDKKDIDALIDTAKEEAMIIEETTNIIKDKPL